VLAYPECNSQGRHRVATYRYKVIIMPEQNHTDDSTVQPIKEFEKLDGRYETPNGVTLTGSSKLSELDDEDLIACGRCGTVREDLGVERNCPTCTIYEMLENLDERLQQGESQE